MTRRKPATAETGAPTTGEAVSPSETKSVLEELDAYLDAVSEEIPFKDLLGKFKTDGWVWRLKSTSAAPQMHSLPDTVMFAGNFCVATLALLVGRKGGRKQLFDTVTTTTPLYNGSPTFEARAMANALVTNVLFNRMPPIAQKETTTVEVDEGTDDIILPTGGEKVANYVADIETSEPESPEPEEETGPSIVKGKTPDGIIELEDLYEIEGHSSTIAAEAADVLIANIGELTTTEQLGALYTRNEASIEFLKDFGGADELREALDKRKGQIENGYAEDVKPRRRPRSSR